MNVQARPDSLLYCTWSHRRRLPPALSYRFRDLDHFVRELAASATSRLVIVAPYLTPEGVMLLRPSIATSTERGAWIRVVTGDLENTATRNRAALETLVEGEDGALIRPRLRVLTPSNSFGVLVHAKVILADGTRGYLGSANLSWSAMERNFELGIALQPSQVETLDDSISFFEGQGMLVDATPSIFPA